MAKKPVFVYAPSEHTEALEGIAKKVFGKAFKSLTQDQKELCINAHMTIARNDWEANIGTKSDMPQWLRFVRMDGKKGGDPYWRAQFVPGQTVTSEARYMDIGLPMASFLLTDEGQQALRDICETLSEGKPYTAATFGGIGYTRLVAHPNKPGSLVNQELTVDEKKLAGLVVEEPAQETAIAAAMQRAIVAKRASK